MELSVKEALHVFPLSEGKLVAGGGGISRIISAINLMDAPDIINWMKEGELLLTTAYAIKDSPEEFVLLLQKLHERNSAGLGIKLGRYWSEIPEVALREADRLNLPLIELPFEFTFSEQITALFQNEFKRSTKRLNDLLETQKKLVDFAMRADEYTQYFPSVSSILEHDIAIVGSSGQLLHNTTVCTEEELLGKRLWEAGDKPVKMGRVTLSRIPLLKSGKTYGFLIVSSANLPEAYEKEGLFHQAAVILSYHLEQIQDQEYAAAGNRLGKTIELIVEGRAAEHTLAEAAIGMGSPIFEGAYLCITADLSIHKGDMDRRSKMLRDLHGRLREHPNAADIESLHFYVADRLLSLFALSEETAKNLTPTRQTAQAFGEIIISMYSASEKTSCYVSRVKHGADELLEGYRECVEAQRISELLAFEMPVIFFPDLEFAYLLRHIPPEIRSKFGGHILRPLLQKEEEYAAEMLRTLETYFAHHGQINDTAKELFIHRNTVIYRMEKISDLLRLDLKNTDQLLQLKLALAFRHMGAMEPKGQPRNSLSDIFS
ncbi:PucR family transcriptional regulator [Paenibacillus sp. LPE1-1-1.1]|uniref:PucR family transcriptional regulator n=1 Tax=Paenibacillus sp. LPE1-1-1.1 TaxID=3135230 RepID=UPI00342B3BF4